VGRAGVGPNLAAAALDTSSALPACREGSGPQWLHEIKLDGFRMAARIDHNRAQLLTRTGLDWTDKYPSAIAALANLNVKTAYIDGELCGVDDAGLPSFANTQAATDGERGVRLRRANIISGRYNLVVATLPKRDYQSIHRGGDGRNDGE
jgi:ATP-dependent DNA ligase